jgi:hypothetical protein
MLLAALSRTVEFDSPKTTSESGDTPEMVHLVFIEFRFAFILDGLK